MSISNLERKIKYIGDGTSVEFSFNFRVLAADDLRVYLVDEDVSPNQLTLQNIETDYTISINENEGGSVTFLTSPTAGLRVLLFRDTPGIQALELSTTTRFPAQQIENALDRVAIQGIESAETIERAVKLPENIEGVNILLPAPVDGMQLQWSGDDGEIVNVEAVNASLLATVANSADGIMAGLDAAQEAATQAEMSATDAAASAASIMGDVDLAEAARDAAALSATAASDSEIAAGLSETNAAASATAAGTSETNASDSALAAATSETNAMTSETNAGLAADAAEVSELAADGSAVAAAASAVMAAASAAAAVVTANSIGDLDSLSDIDLTTAAPADGETLVFDAASGNFIPGAAASGGGGDPEVDLGVNTFVGRQEFTGGFITSGPLEFGARPVITNSSNSTLGLVLSRSDGFQTNWRGTLNTRVRGFFNENDTPTNNNILYHTLRNSSTIASLTLVNDSVGSWQEFDCPNGKDLVLQPQTQALLMLDGSQRWEVVSVSALPTYGSTFKSGTDHQFVVNALPFNLVTLGTTTPTTRLFGNITRGSRYRIDITSDLIEVQDSSNFGTGDNISITAVRANGLPIPSTFPERNSNTDSVFVSDETISNFSFNTLDVVADDNGEINIQFAGLSGNQIGLGLVTARITELPALVDDARFA